MRTSSAEVGDTYSVSKIRVALVHFLGGRLVQSLARAALLLLLVRLLPVNDYGAYMLMVGLSEMLLQATSFGILPVTQRYVPVLQRHPAFSGWLLMLCSLQFLSAFACVVLLNKFWSPIGEFLKLGDENIQITRNALPLLLLVPVFRYVAEVLEALLQQGRAQYSRALMPVLRVSGIGLCLLLSVEIDLATVFWIDIAATLFCVLLAYGLLVNSVHRLPHAQPELVLPAAEMIRYGWHMWAVDLLNSLSTPGAIRMALSATLGVATAGLFAFLQSLERLVSRYLPGTLLRGIIRPVLIDRYENRESKASVASCMNLLIKFNLLIVSGAVILGAAAGDQIIALLSGNKFMAAGTTLFIMLVSLGLTSQRNIVDMMMRITRQTAVLRATALIVPAGLGIIMLAPLMTLNNALVVLAACAFLSISVAYQRLRHFAPVFLIDWSGVFRIVLPATLCVLVSFLAVNSVSLIVLLVLSLVSFGIILLFTRPLAPDEGQLLETMLGKRVRRLLGPLIRRGAASSQEGLQ